MTRRINVGDAAMVALVMQARRRDDPVAALHGRERCRAGRVGPAHLVLELRTRAVAAVDAHQAALLPGRIARNRVFDRPRGSLGACMTWQHRGHAHCRDHPCPAKQSSPCCCEREHAVPAFALLQSGKLSGLRLLDRLADAGKRLFERTGFLCDAFGAGHAVDLLAGEWPQCYPASRPAESSCRLSTASPCACATAGASTKNRLGARPPRCCLATPESSRLPRASFRNCATSGVLHFSTRAAAPAGQGHRSEG